MGNSCLRAAFRQHNEGTEYYIHLDIPHSFCTFFAFFYYLIALLFMRVGLHLSASTFSEIVYSLSGFESKVADSVMGLWLQLLFQH